MTMKTRNRQRRKIARLSGICSECNADPRDTRADGTQYAKCRDCREVDKVRGMMQRNRV